MGKVETRHKLSKTSRVRSVIRVNYDYVAGAWRHEVYAKGYAWYAMRVQVEARRYGMGIECYMRVKQGRQGWVRYMI